MPHGLQGIFTLVGGNTNFFLLLGNSFQMYALVIALLKTQLEDCRSPALPL